MILITILYWVHWRLSLPTCSSLKHAQEESFLSSSALHQVSWYTIAIVVRFVTAFCNTSQFVHPLSALFCLASPTQDLLLMPTATSAPSAMMLATSATSPTIILLLQWYLCFPSAPVLPLLYHALLILPLIPSTTDTYYILAIPELVIPCTTTTTSNTVHYQYYQ